MNASMRTNGSTLLRLGGGLVLLLATGSALASTVAPPASGVTYVYTDPQGTPLAEADVHGNITATFDYAPYGNQALGTAPNGPGYTGHVNDPDTGLVYMQARYYDPVVGRFISTDPVGPSEGNTFNFNRFAYANNNPVVNMDPDGRCTGSLISGACSGGESIAGPGSTTFVNPGESEGGRDKAQQQAPPADQKLTNVVYNELGSGRADPKAKPSAPGSADDLANGRQAVAEIANRVMDAGHPNRVAPSDLNDDAAVKTDAYAKSRVAADAALNGSNISNGATQYRTRVNGDITTPVGKSSTNPGTPVSQHYGPFIEGNHTFVIIVAQ